MHVYNVFIYTSESFVVLYHTCNKKILFCHLIVILSVYISLDNHVYNLHLETSCMLLSLAHLISIAKHHYFICPCMHTNMLVAT